VRSSKFARERGSLRLTGSLAGPLGHATTEVAGERWLGTETLPKCIVLRARIEWEREPGSGLVGYRNRPTQRRLLTSPDLGDIPLACQPGG